jgi:hypothetical protein
VFNKKKDLKETRIYRIYKLIQKRIIGGKAKEENL